MGNDTVKLVGSNPDTDAVAQVQEIVVADIINYGSQLGTTSESATTAFEADVRLAIELAALFKRAREA